MINFYKVRRVCCEPIELIENYAEAMADQTQTWCCHHRLGVRDGKTVTAELKANGMYEHRPASELIFVTRSQHSKLHADMQLKASKAGGKKGGKALTFEHHSKLGKKNAKIMLAKLTREQRAKGGKGKKWWNNGSINIRAIECPEECFVRGRLPFKRNGGSK